MNDSITIKDVQLLRWSVGFLLAGVLLLFLLISISGWSLLEARIIVMLNDLLEIIIEGSSSPFKEDAPNFFAR